MARVLLFGRLSDLAGWRDREIESPFLSALRAKLAEEDADLGAALAGPGVQVALDQVIERHSVRFGLSRQRLERLSRHDPLTGLLNRRAMDELLAQEEQRARRLAMKVQAGTPQEPSSSVSLSSSTQP